MRLLLSACTFAAALAAQDVALKLDHNVVTFPDHAALRLGQSFTIEAWVARYGTPYSTRLFERLVPNVEHKALTLMPNAVWYLTWGSPWPLQTAAVAPWSGWTHVAYVREPTGHAVFVNGIAVASGGPGPCGPSCLVGEGAAVATIGSPQGSGFAIDELRISRVARYHGPFTPQRFFATDGDTALLLPFEEGQGASVFDTSGNGQIGTMSGTPQWVLIGPPPTFSAFGTGCAGVAYQPSIGPDGTSLPAAGTTFWMAVTGLPPSPWNITFGLLGFSASSSQGMPLPRDLGALGMPSCLQYIDPHPAGLTLFNNGGGTGYWSVQIPNTAWLLRTNLYFQAVVNMPGANAAGLITSRAAHGTIGAIFP